MKNLTKILVSIYVAIMMIAVACKKDDPTPTSPATTPTTTPPVITKSTAKDISKFSFATLNPVVDATIDASTKAITATVPAGTDITKLVPTITISDKASVLPVTGVVQDFSKEVSYTVTAEDASTVVYKVNVKKEAVVISIPDPKPEDNNSPDGMYYGDSQKLGVLNINTGEKIWEIVTYNGFLLPEVSNGIVYAVYDAKIKAVSATDGSLKWEKKIGPSNEGYSNPKIQSGVLVVATIGHYTYNNAATSIPAKVIGLDPLTGNQLWEYKQTQNINGGGSSLSLTASDGNIYVVQDNKTIAIEAKTGKLKWEIGGDYSISEYNGFLLGRYNVTTDGRLSYSNAIYKFDKLTGSPSILVSNIDVHRSSYVVSSGTLYFVDGDNSNAKIYAVDANTGVSKWTTTAPNAKLLSSNSPIVYNGLVYFSGEDNVIYAYDSQTGVKKWETKTEGNNRVLIASKNVLYSTNNALNSDTGQIKWSKTGSNEIDPGIFNFKLIKDKKLYEAKKSINDK